MLKFPNIFPMNECSLIFWVLFGALSFLFLLLSGFVLACLITLAKLKQRFQNTANEIREIGLRVIILETRLEERTNASFHAPAAIEDKTPKKRGRPKKNPLE